MMNEKMFEPVRGEVPEIEPTLDVNDYADTLDVSPMAEDKYPATEQGPSDFGESEKIVGTMREFALDQPETMHELPRFDIDPLPTEDDATREEVFKEPVTETLKSVDAPKENIESTDEVSGVRVVAPGELPSGYTRKEVPNFEISSLGEAAPILDASGDPIQMQYQELFDGDHLAPQESTQSGTLKSPEEWPNDTLKAA